MAQWVRVWESSAWQEQADAWVSHALEAYGVKRTGELTKHTIGLSSAVFTALTEAGPVYLKAPAPARQSEGALVSLIAPRTAGHVVEPLAVEPDEGWMLSPSTGQSLSDVAHAARRRGDTSQPLSPRVMGAAVETQLALGSMAEELTKAGLLAGLLPADMEFHLESAIQRHASLPAEHPLTLSSTDAKMLLARVPQAAEAGAALEASGIADTLVPSALALSDVLIPSSRRSPVAFLGWGAPRWSHPFVWVAPAIQEATARRSGSSLEASLEAYLSGFSKAGSVRELTELFGPAALVAVVQQHQDLMDLLLASEREDQVVSAPKAFGLLEQMLSAPTDSRRHRH